MKVLAIETTCDETAIAVIDKHKVLSNKIYSQVELHKDYGGVVPEIAARSHVEVLPMLLDEGFNQAKIKPEELDVVAATGGPGLIGGVMVGVTYAKTIASILKKKFIAINHLEGHALSVFLSSKKLRFPYLLLLVSGGHCQIIVVSDLGKYKIVGNTLDDAAGEAFDKVAKMLDLDYPGGPAVEKIALDGDENKFQLPKPMYHKSCCNFSFSGLKTAVRNIIANEEVVDYQFKADICASFQFTVAQILNRKINTALNVFREMHPSSNDIVIAGGVAANKYLRRKVLGEFERKGYNITVPDIKFCTDNAVMIAYAAYKRAVSGQSSDLSFSPLSRWPIDNIQY